MNTTRGFRLAALGMDLFSGAVFSVAALCGCGLMAAVSLSVGAVLAVMVVNIAISFAVHWLWPAGPLGDKVRRVANLASEFIAVSGGLMLVAHLVGGPGMVAAVAVVTGGLAAAGYLLCLAAPLGGQVRLAAGLTAASFTASAVMVFVMPLAAPFSRDWPPYLGLLPLLEGRADLHGTKSPNSPYYLGLLPPFFTFWFTLGLVYGVYESCKKVTAEAGRSFENLWKGTLLTGSVPCFLWLYSEKSWKIMGLRMWAGTVFALALVTTFLFFVAVRTTARAARRAAGTPPGPPSIKGGEDSQALREAWVPPPKQSVATAPLTKQYDDKQLCYLCGKPLEADERTARVCQACRV